MDKMTTAQNENCLKWCISRLINETNSAGRKNGYLCITLGVKILDIDDSIH